MTENIQQIIQVMTGIYGWDISHFDESFLCKTLVKRLAAIAITTHMEYYEYLGLPRPGKLKSPITPYMSGTGKFSEICSPLPYLNNWLYQNS
jgi:hypothetical protein